AARSPRHRRTRALRRELFVRAHARAHGGDLPRCQRSVLMERSSRLAVRSRVLSHALALRLARGPRQRPGAVRRVLVAHELLAGDTLMLTPLLAKLRSRYPQ